MVEVQYRDLALLSSLQKHSQLTSIHIEERKRLHPRKSRHTMISTDLRHSTEDTNAKKGGKINKWIPSLLYLRNNWRGKKKKKNLYSMNIRQAIVRFTFNEPAGNLDSTSMKVFSIARSEKALPKSSAI